MPWNPQTYNQFKTIRYQPFFDLSALITEENLSTAIDLGCGTGEQTAILAEQFPRTSFVGIDASPEMLAETEKHTRKNLQFQKHTIEAFAADTSTWDLIFSNAALQWADDHQALFPTLISKLNPGGQFAVQMPVQNENLLNKILLDLAAEQPYARQLQNWTRPSTVLSIDEYAQILFSSGLQNIQIIQKVYPIIANTPQELFDFIAGSSLIPYLERLTAEEQEAFVEEYKKRIVEAYGQFPAMYAFKRLLLYGSKS